MTFCVLKSISPLSCDRLTWEWTTSYSRRTPNTTAKTCWLGSYETSWSIRLSRNMEFSLALIGGAETAEVSYNIDIMNIDGNAQTDCVRVCHGNRIFERNEYTVLSTVSTPWTVLSTTAVSNIEVMIDITMVNVETVVGIPQSTFSSDIKSAIENNEEYQDTTLIVGQEDSKEEIKANKFMLMARSPVFAQMFQIDMKEKSTNIVEIPDVSPKVFKTVLSYIYTGKVNKFLSLEDTISMMNTAGKYNLDHLKALCENRLATLLCKTNAAHVLAMAEIFSCSELKCEAIKFITQSNDICGEVMKTKGWKEVKDCGELVAEVLSSVIDPSPKRRKLF